MVMTPRGARPLRRSTSCWTSDDQELREIAKDYANDVNPPTFTPVPNQKRCALLVRAIPHLIARIDGNESGSAYSILIFIQP